MGGLSASVCEQHRFPNSRVLVSESESLFLISSHSFGGCMLGLKSAEQIREDCDSEMFLLIVCSISRPRIGRNPSVSSDVIMRV